MKVKGGRGLRLLRAGGGVSKTGTTNDECAELRALRGKQQPRFVVHETS